jgi:hypothetical protein
MRIRNTAWDLRTHDRSSRLLELFPFLSRESVGITVTTLSITASDTNWHMRSKLHFPHHFDGPSAGAASPDSPAPTVGFDIDCTGRYRHTVILNNKINAIWNRWRYSLTISNLQTNTVEYTTGILQTFCCSLHLGICYLVPVPGTVYILVGAVSRAGAASFFQPAPHENDATCQQCGQVNKKT